MKRIYIFAGLIIGGIVIIATSLYAYENSQSLESQPFQDLVISSKNPTCLGNAGCIAGKVTAIIDGDTIEVDGIRIRLALTSTPELTEQGGNEAKEFTANFCPVGSQVLVDEDDEQTEGSFDRTIGLVYCGHVSLNFALLLNDLGYIDKRFCSESEFANEEWAKTYGC